MNAKPLAYRLRPESLDDIMGQQHLIGEKRTIFSFIFFGSPDIGKSIINCYNITKIY